MNAAPHFLLLETSGRVGTVAVATEDTLLAQVSLDQAQRHARDLVPAIAQLLKGQGWTARDLAGIFVSRGPGSYTGLRVGLMSAKTLAYAIGCRLILVDTFAAIADRLQRTPRWSMFWAMPNKTRYMSNHSHAPATRGRASTRLPLCH